jgi:hypothetical protein
MQTRAQHYLFAHRLLPSVFFQNPGQLIGALEQQGPALLTDMWNHTAQFAPEAPPLPAEGLSVELRRIPAGWTVALVTLPRPCAMTEAHFTALAVKPTGERQVALPAEAARYVTLELSTSLEGDEPFTMLCEWTSDGTHANMGEGPPPDLEAFFQRVTELLAEGS